MWTLCCFDRPLVYSWCSTIVAVIEGDHAKRKAILTLIVSQTIKHFPTLSLVLNGLKHTLFAHTLRVGTSMKLYIYRLHFHFELLAVLSILTLIPSCLIIHYRSNYTSEYFQNCILWILSFILCKYFHMN